MIIAALLSFGILLAAWIFAPSETVPTPAEPKVIEPGAEAVPLAA
jgi:hypothetical protein